MSTTGSLDPSFGELLLRLVRRELEARLRGSEPSPSPDLPSWIHEPGATFVTLRRGDRLRGCMGSLEARRPLLQDLRDNAVASATQDPRFPPVEAQELADLRIEISLLTPPRALDFHSEQEARGLLRPGIDGVILQWNRHRSTFLPQVWEQVPKPRDFLRELKKKAGLPQDFWADTLELATYQVQKWSE